MIRLNNKTIKSFLKTTEVTILEKQKRKMEKEHYHLFSLVSRLRQAILHEIEWAVKNMSIEFV